VKQPDKQDLNKTPDHPELTGTLPPLPPVILDNPRQSTRSSEIVTRGLNTTSVEIIK